MARDRALLKKAETDTLRYEELFKKALYLNKNTTNIKPVLKPSGDGEGG
ncbi:MAG: hypothetical protein U0586_02795 [Candidatus Brocadiaceae bacterium]